MFGTVRRAVSLRPISVVAGLSLALLALAACGETESEAPPSGEVSGGTQLGSGGATALTGGVLVTGGEQVDAVVDGSGGTTEAPPMATGGSATPVDSSFCAALEVVQRNCHNCHGAERKAGAPMPLLTYADMVGPSALDPSKNMPELLMARIHDPSRPMPPAPAILSDTDKAILDTWLSEGAPAGADPTCGGTDVDMSPEPTEETVEWPADCEEVYQLVTSDPDDPSKPFTVPANSEIHPQFYFDAPWGDDEVQIVAERPITDNAAVLHHWILYDVNTRAFITGWAPGKEGRGGELPADVGMYAPKGPRSLNLDLHYYNLGNDSEELDMSGVELCVTRKLRPKTATVFGRLAALPSIPANSRVDNVGVCNVRTTDEVHFLSNSPHMHQYGRNAKLELTRDGVTTVLHDQPFSFEDQTVWPLNDIEIKNGDVLTTTCTFENTSSSRVTFGDSSNDEMCFNFVLYYPMGALSCSRF